MSDVSLRQLEYFQTIAEEGNVTRAAKQLHLTQPALSQQLRALEKSFGVPLIQRTNHGVVLTPAGQVLNEEGRALLQRARALSATVSRASFPGRGSLTVGAVPESCKWIMPYVLKDFRTAYPQIDVTLIELDTGHLYEQLANGAIEVGITRIRHGLVGSTAPFSTSELITDQAVAAVPVTHELAGRDEIWLADLAETRLILYSRSRGSRYFDAFITACRDRGGFDPEDIVEVDTFAAQLALIGGGYGIGVATEISAQQPAPGVVFRSFADLHMSAPIVEVHHSEIRNPAVPAFAKSTRETMAALYNSSKPKNSRSVKT